MLIRLPLPILLAISLQIFFATLLNAQIKTAYNIGSIGTLGATSPSYTGPVVVSISTCFTINNGVSNLTAIKKGVFSNSCPISAPIATNINIRCFPNPVQSYVTVQALTVSSTDRAPITMLVMTTDGRSVSEYITTIPALISGYTLRTNQLSNGEYFIRIFQNSQVITTLKFLKQN